MTLKTTPALLGVIISAAFLRLLECREELTALFQAFIEACWKDFALQTTETPFGLRFHCLTEFFGGYTRVKELAAFL